MFVQYVTNSQVKRLFDQVSSHQKTRTHSAAVMCVHLCVCSDCPLLEEPHYFSLNDELFQEEQTQNDQ